MVNLVNQLANAEREIVWHWLVWQNFLTFTGLGCFIQKQKVVFISMKCYPRCGSSCLVNKVHAGTLSNLFSNHPSKPQARQQQSLC